MRGLGVVMPEGADEMREFCLGFYRGVSRSWRTRREGRWACSGSNKGSRHRPR